MKRKSNQPKNYQCSMFTSEQMSGSGQLNLIDLIERTEESNKPLK